MVAVLSFFPFNDRGEYLMEKSWYQAYCYQHTSGDVYTIVPYNVPGSHAGRLHWSKIKELSWLLCWTPCAKRKVLCVWRSPRGNTEFWYIAHTQSLLMFDILLLQGGLMIVIPLIHAIRFMVWIIAQGNKEHIPPSAGFWWQRSPGYGTVLKSCDPDFAGIRINILNLCTISWLHFDKQRAPHKNLTWMCFMPTLNQKGCE